MTAKHDKLRTLAQAAVSTTDCELWGVELSGAGKHSVLRVYIDKEGGVGIEDCASVSRQLGGVLDVEDPVAGEYTLEVSSPGLDRPLFELAHYEKYIGAELTLQLRLPYEGRRKFKGRLKGLENTDIVLEMDSHEYLFPIEGIEKARVVPHF